MKPEPVNKNIVCSVCSLDWDAHRDYINEHMKRIYKPQEVTTEVCVELLKAELAKRPKWQPNQFLGTTYTPRVTQ